MALSLSPASRHQLTNGLTAFSLGTLCFIRRWYDLENLQPRGLDYFRDAPGSLTLLGSTIVSALLLASVFWIAWCVVERTSPDSAFGRRLRTIAHVAFVLVLMYPIESVRRYWNTQTDHFDYGSNISLWVVEAILACGILMLLAGNRRILAPTRRVALLLLLLFPALMIDFLTNHAGAEQAEVYTPPRSAPMLPERTPGSPRVIIMVFDELDQQLAFDRRPAYLKLPALDQLRDESVATDHATQTAMYTAIALPSLISGRIFGNAQAADANTLNLWPRGSTQAVDWRKEPTMLTRARAIGVNAALVGWHHPYCRILGDQMVDCFALPSTHSTAALAEEAQASQDGVWKTVQWLFEWQFANVHRILTNRGQAPEDLRDLEIQRSQQQQYFQIRDQAYRLAADPRIGLLFVHFPAPHLFPIYNRREQSFRLEGDLDYFDNVALVDRTLSELRHVVDQAGLTDRTALLLTADHGLRPGAWIGRLGWTPELDRLTGRQPPSTVPFILKMPGETRPLKVDKTFSNVVAGDLALAVLDGKVATPAQAEAWMNQQVPDDGGAQPAAAQASVRPAE